MTISDGMCPSISIDGQPGGQDKSLTDLSKHMGVDASCFDTIMAYTVFATASLEAWPAFKDRHLSLSLSV